MADKTYRIDYHMSDGSVISGGYITAPQGEPGYTPVKGVDYWTAADQESIVQQVIAALGTPVFGRVEDDNNIILTANGLPDGTYTYWLEDKDGKTTVIGTAASTPPIVYECVYGLPSRDSSTSIVYYSDNDDGTSQKMLYQTTGDVPLYTSASLDEESPYYPLEVPAGKTKIVVTFPNLASDKALIMAVRALSLDGNAYTQETSSGWLTAGVYEWTFAAGTKFIAPYFRNDAYSGLNYYDTSGVTVSWE